MNNIILALDIDDCIYPTNNTYLGRVDDNLEILKLNMRRISMMVEKYDMDVFITSAWFSVLEINDDNTLGYEREEIAKTNDYFAEEYSAFKLIRDGIGNRVVGLSCGDRYKDITKLLNDGYVVVSMDDMDLQPEKITKLSDTKIEDEVLMKNYLFLETTGFITNRLTYKLFRFMNNHKK